MASIAAVSVACIVIASEKRAQLVRERVLPSIIGQAFDEIAVVADYSCDTGLMYGVHWLDVEPLTHTTTDALVKRDVGTLATVSRIVVYVCDDHALGPQFEAAVRAVADEPWDVLVPNRFTTVGGLRVPLNNGERDGYCGGHAGVFRRSVVQRLPWSAGPHDRLWDRNMSVLQRAHGARFVWAPRADIEVEDLEPEREPWC